MKTSLRNLSFSTGSASWSHCKHRSGKLLAEGPMANLKERRGGKMKKLVIIAGLVLGMAISSVYAINISQDTILDALNETHVEAAKQIQGATVPEGEFNFNAAYTGIPDFQTEVNQLARDLGAALDQSLAEILGKSVDQISEADIPNPGTPEWDQLISKLDSARAVKRVADALLRRCRTDADVKAQTGLDKVGAEVTVDRRALIDSTL